MEEFLKKRVSIGSVEFEELMMKSKEMMDEQIFCLYLLCRGYDKIPEIIVNWEVKGREEFKTPITRERVLKKTIRTKI